jgi:DNA-binding response OmpR family regulator
MDKAVIEILLIEDNLADTEYLKEMLSAGRQPAFAIQHATRLSQGASLLGKKRFDIVLLDLGLPDSQGIDTLMSIRKEAPDVPVLILTGLADEDFALKAIKSGADDYLIKGQITDTLLVRTIRYTIERKHITEELRQSEGQCGFFSIQSVSHVGLP